MRFSVRYGFKPVKNTFQIDSMDDELRNCLWSALQIFYWDKVKHTPGTYSAYRLSTPANEPFKALCTKLWIHYFKKPLDTLSDKWRKAYDELRDFFFRSEWYEVYDFIEFISQNFESKETNELFMKACNSFFEREVSVYRFVGNRITRIDSEEEISTIEEGLQVKDRPVREHLNRSLQLLSDRKSPDYRNSIKESISAVEFIVKSITKSGKGTLGALLNELEKSIGLHPALKSAFNKLYGYTSDENGIRHALLGESNVTFEEAKFMLVACSAFINYVVGTIKR